MVVLKLLHTFRALLCGLGPLAGLCWWLLSFTTLVRCLLGTGPPDPTLESASPSPPQGSIWHRFDIDSTLIRHRNRVKSGNRCRINVESMLNRCQIDPWGWESEVDSRVGSGGPVPNKPLTTQLQSSTPSCSKILVQQRLKWLQVQQGMALKFAFPSAVAQGQKSVSNLSCSLRVIQRIWPGSMAVQTVSEWVQHDSSVAGSLFLISVVRRRGGAGKKLLARNLRCSEPAYWQSQMLGCSYVSVCHLAVAHAHVDRCLNRGPFRPICHVTHLHVCSKPLPAVVGPPSTVTLQARDCRNRCLR